MFCKSKAKTVLVVLVAMISLAPLAGCHNYEQQIAARDKRIDELMVENKQQADDLIAAQNENAALKTEIAAKNQAIAERDEIIKNMGISDGKKESADGWEIGKFGDRVSIGSDVLFSSGSAKLTQSGRRTLDKIASDIQRKYPGMTVRVYGYTDSDPIRKTRHLWDDNLDLSANRAMAVARHLKGRGINAANIESVAMGATNFVASNKTKDGKKRNRRVEIYVIKSIR